MTVSHSEPQAAGLSTCSRCGHESLVVFRKARAGDFQFCGHHATEHETALIGQGWTMVLDLRPGLIAREDSR